MTPLFENCVASYFLRQFGGDFVYWLAYVGALLGCLEGEVGGEIRQRCFSGVQPCVRSLGVANKVV